VTANRDAVIKELAAEGVQSKPYLPAIHLMRYYRERFGHQRNSSKESLDGGVAGC
jgi:dTDP-4-amino-4,6-dideoxygalactose transaminase